MNADNEQEEMLKEYRVYIFKATVAALKGTLDEEGEGDGDDDGKNQADC
jgi:hypothetical protein